MRPRTTRPGAEQFQPVLWGTLLHRGSLVHHNHWAPVNRSNQIKIKCFFNVQIRNLHVPRIKKRQWASCFLFSYSTNLELSYTYCYQRLTITWLLQTSPQHSLLLPLHNIRHLSTPPHLWFIFLNFGALPIFLHYYVTVTCTIWKVLKNTDTVCKNAATANSCHEIGLMYV